MSGQIRKGGDRRPALELDPVVLDRARRLAERAAEPVVMLARTSTTVSVERATLRLAGLSGADAEGVPWANHLVDAVRGQVGLEHGVCLPVWDALDHNEAPDLLTLAQKAAVGSVTFRIPQGREARTATSRARAPIAAGLRRIDAGRRTRTRLVNKLGDPRLRELGQAARVEGVDGGRPVAG